jgi:O-antigen/teichoic acid export membrane protein
VSPVATDWRKIFKDSSLFAGSGFAAAGAAALTRIVLARALTPADLGVIVTAQALAAFVGFVATMALPEAVVQRSSQETATSRWESTAVALRICGLTTVMSAAVLVIGARIVSGTYGRPDLAYPVQVLAIAIPFGAIAEVLAAGHRGLGDVRPKTIVVDLGRPVLALLAVVGVYWLGNPSIRTVSLALLSAYVGAALIVSARTPIRSFRLAADHTVTARALLKYSLPLLGAGVIAGPLVNSGLPLIIGLSASQSDVALYAIAVSLQTIVYLPIAALEQSLLPSWSTTDPRSPRVSADFRRATRIGVLLASVPCALLWSDARSILAVVYGPLYAGAEWATRIAAVAAFLGVAAGPNEAILKGVGDTRWIWRSRLTAAIVGVAAALIAAPFAGAVGGATAFCAASVTVNAMYAWALWSRYGLHPIDTEYVVLLGSVTAAIIVTDVLSAGETSLRRLVFSACIYPAALGIATLVCMRFNPVRIRRIIQ